MVRNRRWHVRGGKGCDVSEQILRGWPYLGSQNVFSSQTMLPSESFRRFLTFMTVLHRLIVIVEG